MNRTKWTRLIAVAGPPCSGKSTLASAIETELDATWLEVDRLHHALVPDSLFARDERDIAYRAIGIISRFLLSAGRSVVADATFGPAMHRTMLENVARECKVELYVVESRVSAEDAAIRFLARPDHLAKDLTVERVRDLAARYPYFGGGVTIDGRQPVADALQQVEQYLRDGRPVGPTGAWSTASRAYAVES